MPLPQNFNYDSIEFISIKNNDLNFISTNLNHYLPDINKWLTIATYYSNLDIIQFLIQNNANPKSYLDENFNNAIQNDFSVLCYFIDNNWYDLNLQSNWLGGSVSLAIETKNINILKKIIDLGFNIHLDNDYALQHGVAINFLEGIKYLLSLDKFSFNLNQHFLNILISNDSYESLQYILKNKNISSISIETHPHILKSTPKIFDLLIPYVNFNFNKYSIIFSSFNIELYNHIKLNHNDLYLKMISSLFINANSKYLLPNLLPNLFIENHLFFNNHFNDWLKFELIHLHIKQEEILEGLFEAYLKSENELYLNLFFDILNTYEFNNVNFLLFLDLHILKLIRHRLFPDIIKTISKILPLNSPYPNINRGLLFFSFYEKI